MAEYLQAPPRRKALGLLADALTSGQEALNTVNLPYVGGLGGLLFGQAPQYLQDVSYGMPLLRGGNVATGGLGTLTPDTRMLDVATLPFVGAGAAKAGQVGAKTLGKEVARQVETGTGLLGSNVLDPRQYMFIGEKSKAWDTASNKVAKALEKEGVAPETIWSQTGNVKAPDGKWRQEISDENLQFNEDAYKAFRKKREYQGGPSLKAKTDLYDLVSHPELKKAYPESKDIAILRGNSFEGGGSASPVEWDYINLGIPMWEQRAAQDNQIKETLVHELQHQIQAAENFARGGDTSMFNTITPPKNVQKQLKVAQDKYESLLGGSPERIQAVEDYNKILGKGDKYSPYGQYLRLAGETEARMAANRMNLTPQQRLQYYPYAEGQYGLDVPYNELIVKGLLD